MYYSESWRRIFICFSEANGTISPGVFFRRLVVPLGGKLVLNLTNLLVFSVVDFYMCTSQHLNAAKTF